MTESEVAKLKADAREEGYKRFEADLAALKARVVALEAMGAKVNAIRNSIVGMQGFNFSEHAYPLVAALDEAGFEGDGYELSRKNLGTLIEQVKTAEAERDEAQRQLADGRRLVERLIGERDATRADAQALREALRGILVGKVAADNEHPLGEWFSMAGRFLNIARAALASESPGAALIQATRTAALEPIRIAVARHMEHPQRDHDCKCWRDVFDVCKAALAEGRAMSVSDFDHLKAAPWHEVLGVLVEQDDRIRGLKEGNFTTILFNTIMRIRDGCMCDPSVVAEVERVLSKVARATGRADRWRPAR